MNVNKLDIKTFENSETMNTSLGQFSEDIVNFIIDKKPEFLGRLTPNKDVLFWKSRIKHTENHKKDFKSEEEFYKCFEDIPKILADPDYISIHPKDESVSFIKQYTEKVSVAIKISSDGKMVYRTMYPLDESQLETYIKNNRAWKYK
ncbi:MAG: hypothetical protein LBE23_05965 [Vagococcus sp.]|nr:hypothetical protein [Vagococcus sp.]